MVDNEANKVKALLVTVGFTVLGLSIIGILLLFNPEDPDFQVDSFSLSNLTFTNGSRMFIVSEIQLTAQNPSKKLFRINYDRIVASIYYKHELLSQTGLSAFSQDTGNETSLVLKFTSEWNLVDKWVVDGLNGEIEKNGGVELDFFLFSWINWHCKPWSYWSDKDFLKVFCGDLVVGIPSHGNPGLLTSGPSSCGVQTGDEEQIWRE